MSDVNLLAFKTTLQEKKYYYSQFPDEKLRFREVVTDPQSHSLKMVELDFEPVQIPKPMVLNCMCVSWLPSPLELPTQEATGLQSNVATT